MGEIFLQSGLDKNVVVIILLLPVVATMIGVSRHIFGLRSLGIYLSLVITFIFFKLGVPQHDSAYLSDPIEGLKYGLPLVLLVFASTLLCYLAVKKWALHYYPKLSIVITGVTMILILAIILLAYFDFKNVLRIETFTLILIVSITEKYFSILSRKNFKTTLFISIESIILAAICYLIISAPFVIDTLLQYPYIILALLPINYLVGKFSGLRLSEYLRFWDILTERD
jgi:hypothetical protein